MYILNEIKGGLFYYEGDVIIEMNKVLWTGGWDSTFRILDLVLNKEKTVQPYYILDKRRRSLQVELDTQKVIKDMVNTIDPSARERIKDTIIVDKALIPKNDSITADFEYLLSKSHLGDQYDWLARYAESNGIDDLELCIHLDDKAEDFIRSEAELVTQNQESYYKIKANPSDEQLLIFSYFNFPLLDQTKLDMDRIAKESCFSHIMENTWFCNNPVKGEPCGMCNPCKDTIEEGLGRRVPPVTFSRKVIGVSNKIIHKSKLLIQKL